MAVTIIDMSDGSRDIMINQFNVRAIGLTAELEVLRVHCAPCATDANILSALYASGAFACKAWEVSRITSSKMPDGSPNPGILTGDEVEGAEPGDEVRIYLLIHNSADCNEGQTPLRAN